MELILPREWCHVTTHLTRTLSASAAVFTKYLITPPRVGVGFGPGACVLILIIEIARDHMEIGKTARPPQVNWAGNASRDI